MKKLGNHSGPATRPSSSRAPKELPWGNANCRPSLRRIAVTALVLASLAFSREASAQNQRANFREFADLAVAGLQQYAQSNNGDSEPFTAPNWNNANSVEALNDYVAASHLYFNIPPFVATVNMQSLEYYQINPQFPFCAGSYCGQNDDALWWALAFIAIYDVTADPRYLAPAEGIFLQVSNWWGPAFESGIACRGGVAWQQKFNPPAPGTYPGENSNKKLSGGYDNTVTNSLFLEVAARLARRFCNTGDEPWCGGTTPNSAALPNGQSYLDWANTEFTWFESHFINQQPNHLIGDGLNVEDCENNGSPCCLLIQNDITENNGPILGALFEMALAESEWPSHTATTAQTYIDEAQGIADGVTAGAPFAIPEAICSSGLCGLILTEYGDNLASGKAACSTSPDCPQFKGLFMRNLGRLNFGASQFPFSTTGRYTNFIKNNASSIWRWTRQCAIGDVQDDQFGSAWNGTNPQYLAGVNQQTSQTSALDAFVAAIPYSDPDIATQHISVAADNDACGSAASAFDGDYTTKWCATGPASSASPHWVQTQFPETMLIDAVNIRNDATGPTPPDLGNASWNTASFAIETSMDGRTWSAMASTFGQNLCDTTFFSIADIGSPPGVRATGQPVLANFLRMTVLQDVQTAEESRAPQAARVYEVEAYGQTAHAMQFDSDGDGWPDIDDNCPWVWNPGQENCNLTAESAPNQPGQGSATILGDACDPVPCPNFSIVGSSQNVTCQPNPSCQGQQCSGTFLQDSISVATIGSHFADAVVFGQQPQLISQAIIHDVPTDPRFCEQNPSLGFDCFNVQSVADHFASDPEPPQWSAKQPWHRITMTSSPNQVHPERGAPLSMQYGDFTITAGWAYGTDASYWYQAGIEQGVLPPPAGQPGDCGPGALGGCLDGVLWLHAETAVGNTTTTVGSLTVGSHGQQLANYYAPIQPDRGLVSWCPAAVPGVAGQTSPNPICFSPAANTGVVFAQQGVAQGALANSTVGQEGQVVPESRLLFVVPTINPEIAYLERDGSGVMPVDGQGNCASAGGTPILQKEILDPGLLWVGPAEPNARIGPLSGQVAAMALSADGTQVVDAAINMNGNLSSSCDNKATFSPNIASTVCNGGATHADPPAPRKGFAAVFSRSAGGVFVLGGTATGTSKPMSDMWFQPFGGSWAQLPVQNFGLGTVAAATFSYQDRKLWILDRAIALRGHDAPMRLSRIDPTQGSAETLATWDDEGDISEWFLALDQAGILLSATDDQRSITARLVFDKGFTRIAFFHVEQGRLVHAPVVDDNGYDFVVAGPQHSMRIHRLTTLTGDRPDDDGMDGLAAMEEIGCDSSRH